MENIFLPSKTEIKKGKTSNEASLIIEPLWHGYGTTIGNSLRRVLLSSLPGSAVTSFKIKGVQHEFSAIDGVQEDVLEIMLNLKQLRVKLHSDEPVTLKLVKKGSGDILAKDIAKDSKVEIINPDLKIATITDKATEINMEITIDNGMGFDTTENRDKEDLPVGAIAIDAIYTPIVDVGYRVENTRVGQITNYDKLTLKIETDGSITPAEAINEAVKILIDHFSVLYKEDLPEKKLKKQKLKKPKNNYETQK